MNKETIITAIVTAIVAIFDLLKIFGIVVPIEDNTIYTGTINGEYTARVYGVKLYDLIGG